MSHYAGTTPDSLWISISFFIPKHNPRESGTPQGLPLPICPKHSPEGLEPYSAIFLFLAPTLSGSCSGCGPLSLPLLAGLVAIDAVVSLLVTVMVFVCARLRSRSTQGAGWDRARPGGVGVSLGRRSPWRGPLGKPWRHCWGNPGGAAEGNS